MITLKPNLVNVYLDYFKGREDFVAVQSEKSYYPIKAVLDESLLHKHLNSIQTIGCYVLTDSSQCNFICIDIDIPKSELQKIDFKDSEVKFEYLKTDLLTIIGILINGLGFSNNNLLLEDTGGRGYHIWIFFEFPIDGNSASKIGAILKNKYSVTCEFFPKQGDLNEKRKYGNLIKLPLGEHKSYDQRSKFFIIIDNKLTYFNSLDENIKHLNTIEKVSVSKIEDLLENNIEVLLISNKQITHEFLENTSRIMFKKNLPKLFDNCSAINSLKITASNGILLNHNQAFHLANLLLSVQDAETDLTFLLEKSFGKSYSQQYANSEIDKIKLFRPTSCMRLKKEGICSNYCVKGLEKRNEDPLLKKTNPISLWLEPIANYKEVLILDNILEHIASIENLKISYFKLKKYCAEQEGVFFDIFDFEFFENTFDENIQLISIGLKNKIKVPNIKFDILKIPKKINAEGNIEYRKMAYCSVFDQLIIQAVINIIAPILETQFQDASYGYRLNLKSAKTNDIFEDWTEKYPQFRSNVLNKLREPEIKYYLCCDIKGYYDNIHKSTLIGQIRGLINDDYVFDLIKNVIDSYSFEQNINKGIPQGPAYARAFANLYLNEFDKEISQRSKYYFRYVDDFFILFEDYDQATSTLEWITKKLASLELTLSEDEEKQAIITSADEEEIIVEKMDNLQYAIFDQIKYLSFLDHNQVKKFYTKVSSQIVPAADIKKINKILPSLAYIYSKEIDITIDSTKELVELIDEFAKKKLLFPKKFTKLFSRIINLYTKAEKDLLPFFLNLDENFKTVFLLRLYDEYQKRQNVFKKTLELILIECLDSDDKYLLGFAISIYFKNKDDFNIVINQTEIIKKAISENNEFIGLKFFGNIDYFLLKSDQRKLLLSYFKPSTYYLLKKQFISGSSDTQKFLEIDKQLFTNILSNNTFLLQAECSKMLSLFLSKNSLFDLILNFLQTQQPPYKGFIVNSIGSHIFNKYQNSSSFELESIQDIYKEGIDHEISARILEVIARITNQFIKNVPSPIDGFTKVDSFNECLYYQSNEKQNSFIEIIPYRKFQFETSDDYEIFKKLVFDI